MFYIQVVLSDCIVNLYNFQMSFQYTVCLNVFKKLTQSGNTAQRRHHTCTKFGSSSGTCLLCVFLNACKRSK